MMPELIKCTKTPQTEINFAGFYTFAKIFRMKSINALNISFLIKVYILSVLINIPVCGWQMIHDQKLSIIYALEYFFQAAWTSTLLFIPVSLVFYLITLAGKSMNREKNYFIILFVSAIVPYFIWMAAAKLFEGDGDMQSLASIASFSAFVAVGAYYEMFMDANRSQEKRPA